MRRKIKLGMTILLLLAVILLSRKLSQIVTNERVESTKQVIILDPGHGGEDPGKVGVNGALEKDINLQIARKVREKLEARGFEVVMTREEDIMQGRKKEDLNKRIQLIEKSKAELVVGIHQNSFTDPEVKGAQVFYYSESEEGKTAAQVMKESLKTVDPSNEREIKANSSFFMLKNTKRTTIIVECGFLSNPEEAGSLVNNEYQEQLAEAICLGIVKWLDK
jgi:N-acetylmuramoyl-L-alanine amidase